LTEILCYQCDVCKLGYETKEEAEECEAKHPKVTSTEYKYLEHFFEGRYPFSIIVKFEDGSETHYTR